ncbi:MAG TPA: hypothetical protein DIC34_20390 [Treponema sp.]|nr:MAG: hypothetical protein A2Y36_08000 [Treponema sp. GWA1_62_8]OHE64897.1 MAG: hypothetical protein A2001_16430 [Treponema sp. GWC1_61_84]HCM28863.1 hypothetical protein [Treponema sp.]
MDGTQFIVFFEDPFWVGIVESRRGGRRFVDRVVFGGEPTNAQLIVFMREEFARLLAAAPELPDDGARDVETECAKKARRGSRGAAREQKAGPGKAVLAFHEAFEKRKAEIRRKSAEAKARTEFERFESRRKKKKSARRGK